MKDSGSKFEGTADFTGASFGEADFSECIFERDAFFDKAIFRNGPRDHDFRNSKFKAPVSFTGATLERSLTFSVQKGGVKSKHRGTLFNGKAKFEDLKITKPNIGLFFQFASFPVGVSYSATSEHALHLDLFHSKVRNPSIGPGISSINLQKATVKCHHDLLEDDFHQILYAEEERTPQVVIQADGAVLEMAKFDVDQIKEFRAKNGRLKDVLFQGGSETAPEQKNVGIIQLEKATLDGVAFENMADWNLNLSRSSSEGRLDLRKVGNGDKDFHVCLYKTNWQSIRLPKKWDSVKPLPATACEAEDTPVELKNYQFEHWKILYRILEQEGRHSSARECRGRFRSNLHGQKPRLIKNLLLSDLKEKPSWFTQAAGWLESFWVKYFEKFFSNFDRWPLLIFAWLLVIAGIYGGLVFFTHAELDSAEKILWAIGDMAITPITFLLADFEVRPWDTEFASWGHKIISYAFSFVFGLTFFRFWISFITKELSIRREQRNTNWDK